MVGATIGIIVGSAITVNPAGAVFGGAIGYYLGGQFGSIFDDHNGELNLGEEHELELIKLRQEGEEYMENLINETIQLRLEVEQLLGDLRCRGK